jgi:hypothetical protein
MPTVLIARPARSWRQVPLAALLLAAQVAVGVIVLVLRTLRAVTTLTIAATGHIEHQLATRTGRPALSDTGIAALAAAFAHEFYAAYHQPAR